MSTPPPLLFFILFTEIICMISRKTGFDDSLDDLTDRVIGKHFMKYKCVTYVLNEGVEVTPTQQLPVFMIHLPTEQKVLTESFEQGCGGYVIRVDNKFEVARLLIDAKHRAIANRYNNQKYLFLPMNETDDDLRLMNDTKMFFLPNLILIAPRGDIYLVVTHTTFNHHQHDLIGITYEVLDVWAPRNQSFSYGRNLYADKMSDVKGKKFVFALLNYIPFSLVIKEGNRTVFDGFETRIAAEFVEALNGTWEGLDHPVELWGELLPNGTGKGIVGSVVSHKADFGFGAVYQWFCDETDCSFPLYQSSITCLVPRPQALSGWLTIVLPFKTDTWVTLIIVYLISSISLLCLLLKIQHKKGLNIKDELGAAACDSFYVNFRLQLEQIPAVPKTKNSLFIYVKISVYYYFFVAVLWRGSMSSILTVPRFEKPINDVVDLIGKWPKLKWGANSDAWINSIRASSDSNLIQIVNKFTVYDDETLQKKTKTRDFGYFMEKLPHGMVQAHLHFAHFEKFFGISKSKKNSHYGFSDYINEESMKYLRLMEKNIYTAFGVVMLPKGSPYSEKFDNMILWLFDTGILHKMEVQVSIDRINNRLQNMIKYSNVKDQTIVILAIRHIQGPIYIYFGGMILSSLAFLLEIFIFKSDQSRISNRK